MIGTIRKHSAWLWWIIASLTIISFVVFMSSAPTRGGRGGAGGTYGTIYGHELTGEEVARARNDFAIYFLLNYGEWPEKSRNINAYQIDQQTYVNLLLALKAKAMGVSVPEDAVAEAAGRLLGAPSLVRSFGGNGPVPMDKFVEYVLKPKNLTVDDFQHSVRFQIAADQLRKTLGLSGALVPPQEASGLYDRENQQAAAQVVFFSSSNYVSKVTVSPAVVAQFYTNRQAAYRVPERMTLNYVYFNVTNYLAQAKAEWAKTNFDQLVDSLYKQNMATMFKDTKADDAKAKIREELVFKRAMADANDQAAAFVTELFAMSPVNPNNLVTLAQKQNLAPKVTAPFAAGNQPVEFANAPNLMRSVYNLNGETPYTDRVMGEDGFYVVGLGQEYPSYNPNYTDIAERVKLDYLNESAAALARQAATNFSIAATVQTAAGQTFAQSAVSSGQAPVVLTPFSLRDAEVPEAAGRADVSSLKQAAFTTQPGKISGPVLTADGAFVMFVQKIIAPDTAKKNSEMSAFLSQIRRGRENEAFSVWVNTEASRELANIPALQKAAAAGSM